MNFWDFEAWGLLNLIVALLASLLIANVLKKTVKFLEKSLIPTAVLGGLILLTVSSVYRWITGEKLFDTVFFGGNGAVLEIITYHALALGFIASSLKISDKKMTGKRGKEIFDSGVTTVSCYLLQGVFGLGITIVLALTVIPTLFPASGVILPFGFGQGSGQALNYGTMYENRGFIGGSDFGLAIAALGFLSASIGGVTYLHMMKKKGRLKGLAERENQTVEKVEDKNEIPMNGDIDKFTVQIIFIALAYLLTYLLMYGICSFFAPGSNMVATIYGFNFLFGVICATLIKLILKTLTKKGIMKKQYVNNFILTRISNTCFDIMIVAGIAAIDLWMIAEYWVVLLILAVVGLVITFVYNLIVAKTLFKDYSDEQFLAMYGMLTGTASTGVMLLREVDPEFKTCAQDNLIYQTLVAIIFGFPIMFLAPIAPDSPYLVLGILATFFVVLNVILFRTKLFPKFFGDKKVEEVSTEK